MLKSVRPKNRARVSFARLSAPDRNRERNLFTPDIMLNLHSAISKLLSNKREKHISVWTWFSVFSVQICLVRALRSVKV